MRFGICTGPENTALLAEAGYDYIELGMAPHLQPELPQEDVLPALAEALGQSALQPETFNLLLPWDLKVVGPQADTARQEQYLDTAFGRAQRLGGQIAVLGSGRSRQIPSDWPLTTAHSQLIEFLQLCGVLAVKHQLQVAIEPLNQAECNHITSVAEACAVAEEVNSPAVGVLSDLYHITQESQSYTETRDSAPWLRHVHVAGEQGRRAPGAADREFLRRYFAVLKEIGYSGRVSVEAQWDNPPMQAAGTLASLREAWEMG